MVLNFFRVLRLCSLHNLNIKGTLSEILKNLDLEFSKSRFLLFKLLFEDRSFKAVCLLKKFFE